MYELVEEASKVLRQPPLEFDFKNPTHDPKEVEEKLSEAMERFGGIGLSANQVGLDVRMFVMRTQDGIQAFFNPELTRISQETDLLKEGCLSFPDIYLMIKRSKVVEMKYFDATGEERDNCTLYPIVIGELPLDWHEHLLYPNLILHHH